MKLGYTSWGTQTATVDELLDTVARIGFDSVELTVIPPWRTDLDRLDAAERRRIRGLLDRHGLGLPALAAHRPIMAKDATQDADNWRRLYAAIDLAIDLAGPAGPPCIDTTMGTGTVEWDAVIDEAVTRVRRLCDYAAARGVVIAIESHVGDLLDTPEKTVNFIRLAEHPALKATFDISHFNIQGIPIEQSVEALAPYTAFTHVKDERGIVPDYQFLIPGEGEFDYARYLTAMQRAGYRRDICVEISMMVQRRPDYDWVAAAEQSYRVLDGAFRAAGVPRDQRNFH